MNKYIKSALTLLLLLAAGLIATQALDQQGQRYTNEALKRALVTFGIARGLNGVISVAQGTEVALQPAGIGLTLTPGQILDPLNDLVERFSWVMLMSSASIGIQKTLLTISAWRGFSAIALILITAALVLLWTPRQGLGKARDIVLKLALLATVLRLSVPLIAIANEWIYQGFLAPQYQQATAQLQQTTDNIGRINRETLPSRERLEEEASLWDSARQFYDSATQSFDLQAKLDQYQKAAADASGHLVNLIVVFFLQTVIFPLAFLAGVYLLLKQLLRFRQHGL